MCYSALVQSDASLLGEEFGAIWTRDQLDFYEEARGASPKAYPPLVARIYPGSYAPVVYQDPDGARRVALMRYGAFPPSFVDSAARYTTFNARRDNLTSRFWSEAFTRCHGVVVLKGFFEWVTARDLLAAGKISLEEITEEFRKQAEARKARILAAGKKYRMTPTEKKAPEERKIVIAFEPEDGRDLVVPVIVSRAPGMSGGGGAQDLDQRFGQGFAIITDEPPPEVAAAGHDRCPVLLDRAAVDTWLNMRQGNGARGYLEALDAQQRAHFGYVLDRVA